MPFYLISEQVIIFLTRLLGYNLAVPRRFVVNSQRQIGIVSWDLQLTIYGGRKVFILQLKNSLRDWDSTIVQLMF